MLRRRSLVMTFIFASFMMAMVSSFNAAAPQPRHDVWRVAVKLETNVSMLRRRSLVMTSFNGTLAEGDRFNAAAPQPRHDANAEYFTVRAVSFQCCGAAASS